MEAVKAFVKNYGTSKTSLRKRLLEGVCSEAATGGELRIPIGCERNRSRDWCFLSACRTPKCSRESDYPCYWEHLVPIQVNYLQIERHLKPYKVGVSMHVLML